MSTQAQQSTWRPAMGWLAHDTVVVARRHILQILRVPETLFFALFQPIMFVLLFAFVFGGAINVGAEGAIAYREYLIPGIFAQTVAFAVASITVGITEDSAKGIMDRFRSLPMRGGAVLGGHTLASLLQNVLVMAAMGITGFLVGWRIRGSFLDAALAFFMLAYFAYALTWLGAWIGLNMPNPQVAGTAGLAWIFPLTFVSNVFTPTATMPDWLAAFAVWNPISCLALGARQLFGNPTPFVGTSFPEQHPVLLAFVWSTALLLVFVPLAVRRFRRATSR